MNKVIFLSFLLLLNACSLDTKSGIWTEKKDLIEENTKPIELFAKNEIFDKEFNSNFEIVLKSNIENNSFNSDLTNNDGRINYDGELKKVSKYKFSKINNFEYYEPKPIFDDNNIIFFDKKGKDSLSKTAWDGISKILNHAQEISLILNSSVNSYRRLDPAFEAPNQIKVSSKDRGSMVRIPTFNKETARIEIRSVAPDANPYLVAFTVLKTITEGRKLQKEKNKRERLSYLPGNINDAIKIFRSSEFTTKIIGEETKNKYIQFKQAAADRSPKELGAKVKRSEIIYHHEITNQMLWNDF